MSGETKWVDSYMEKRRNRDYSDFHWLCSYIDGEHIELGKNFSIGKNVHIDVRKNCKIGDNVHFGDNVKITVENLTIGDHFFHYTPGLEIGGGGSQFAGAGITIGDRCVLHNNYINVARPVSIGDDVGLSPDVKLITHGFWSSCLEGYPTEYKPISLGNNVIVGQGAMFLPGAVVPDNVVIGAASVVSKGCKMKPNAIYAGNPTRFIRNIVAPTKSEQRVLAEGVIQTYLQRATEDGSYPDWFSFTFPVVEINDFTVNLLTREFSGEEDGITIKFRDHLRRYGIRIYTDKGF
jgi:acetyltransferase-like isoleucine patch superfamily enzyme